MNSIEFIKASIGMGTDWVIGLIKDMEDAPLTAPTPNGGNHPLWVLGHLTYSEAELTTELILGKPNPLAEWKEIFGQGSQPVADASKYPPMSQVFDKFQEVRASTLQLLDSYAEADLDQPSQVPEEMKEMFGTVGKCLAATILHFMYHGGQVADARRAAGREPMLG